MSSLISSHLIMILVRVFLFCVMYRFRYFAEKSRCYEADKTGIRLFLLYELLHNCTICLF